MIKHKIKKVLFFLIPTIIGCSFVNSSFAQEFYRINYEKLIKGANPPQLSIYEETNDVGVKVIKADAWDNDGESGISKIELPNGEFVYPSIDNPYTINAEYYPDRTDTYIFKAYDKADNVTEKSIHITIPDVLPSLNVYSKGYEASTNSEIIQINSWVETGGANLSKLELPDGSFIHADLSNPHNIDYTYKATTNGLKTFKVYDVYNRCSSKSIDVTTVKNGTPELSIYESTDDNGIKVIKADAWKTDSSLDIAKLELPTGAFVYPNEDNPYAINTVFYPNKTGTYTFKLYDINNNIVEKSIHVIVEDIFPSLNVYSKGYEASSNSEIIQIDCWVESGGVNLSKLELPDGSFIYPNSSTPHEINHTYKAKNTGLQTFKVYDISGRQTTKTITTKVDEKIPNLEIFLSNSREYADKIAININAWDADYESGIQRVEVSDGTIFNIKNDDLYSINVEHIPSIEKNYTIKAYDKSGKFIEKTIYYDSSIVYPLIECRAIKKSDSSYTLQFDAWTENGTKLSKFKLPDNTFLIEEVGTFSKTVYYDVDSPGLYEFSAIDEFNHAKTVIIRLSEDGFTEVVSPESDLDRAKELVKLAELNKDTNSIEDARLAVNNLPESSEKDLLQDRLNAIIDISDLELEKKSTTSNLDIYIICNNTLSMSLNTNYILFDNYSGVDDIEKTQALEISISSSLPYDLNAYMPMELQNRDGSKKIDLNTFKIKESSESIYNSFENITDKIVLKSDCPSGNNIAHNIDFMLSGNNAYEADIYKTTIKFEVVQK